MSNELSHPAKEQDSVRRTYATVAVSQLLTRLPILPVLIVALIMLTGILEPRFLSADNLIIVLRQATYLTIIAIGQAVVLISGGFDLSVGSIVALTSVVTAHALLAVGQESSAAILATGLAVGIFVGAIFGLINGLCVTILKVSPFIVTLATGSIGYGLALLITGGTPVLGIPDVFPSTLGSGKALGVPAPVYVTAIVIAGIYFLLWWTRIGRHIFALGASERAARLSGVRINFTTTMVFVICGGLVGLAGVLLTARVAIGDSNLGSEFVLQSIAAAVLGGVSLRGGEGRISGVVGGCLFIALLSNSLDLLKVSSYYQFVAIGLVLVGAVAIDGLRPGRSRNGLVT